MPKTDPTEYVELIPDFTGMFETYLHDLPFSASALVRELKQRRTLPNTVEERLSRTNALLYSAAMALNVAQSAKQIDRLREAMNKALAEVNEALRDEQAR